MPCMRPLVIIHGLFGSSKNWTTISRLISNDGERKVYALDLRNHNIQSVSPKLGEMKSWRILKDDLEEFWVETLKSNEFDLLGHSLVSLRIEIKILYKVLGWTSCNVVCTFKRFQSEEFHKKIGSG